MITKLTVTGADDSTAIPEMMELSNRFPQTEWGILVSGNESGYERFPSRAWQKDLFAAWKAVNIMLSAHFCGKFVRNVCQGDWDVLEQIPYQMFSRIQLNFHGYLHKIDNIEKFAQGFKDDRLKHVEFIFQIDNVNNKVLDIARNFEINAFPLFDLSGGAGRLPDKWPIATGYSGYAGGLSADNLAEQLPLIAAAAKNNPYWIDAETRLRKDDDSALDMDAVTKYLEIGSNYQ